MKKLFMIAMAAAFSMTMVAPGFAQEKKADEKKAANPCAAKAEKKDMKKDAKKAEKKDAKKDEKAAAEKK
jgi:hypothetical protein